jgi:hypothetical protein
MDSSETQTTLGQAERRKKNTKKHNTTHKAKRWTTQSSQQQLKHNTTQTAKRWTTQSSEQQQKTQHHTET